MKTPCASRWRPLSGALALGFVTLAVTASAQSLSPVGTWDFTIRGDQKGVAHLTFNDDFTLDGREVVNVLPKRKTDPDKDLRGTGTGGPRVDGPGSSSGTNTIYYFFGAAPVVGVWAFEDTRGGVFGMYSEIGADITNYVSFRGKMVSATKLNLIGHNSKRKFQLRGIPQTPLPDLTGRYVMSGKRDFAPYVSVFRLDADPYATLPNQYLLTTLNSLNAPAVNGVALLSGQGQLAIASREWIGGDPENETAEPTSLFGLSGPYNVTLGRGNITGVNELKERVVLNVMQVEDDEDEESN